MSILASSWAWAANSVRGAWLRIAASTRWMLGYEGVPPLARPTFRQEFIATIFAALGGGVLVQEFVQLFATKLLSAPAWLIGVLAAEVSAGLLLGSFLSQYLRRRRMVRFTVVSRLIIAGAMLLVALLPAEPLCAYIYAILLAVPAVLGALVVNVNSGVWHANYPHASRGRIYSRLMVAGTLAGIVSIRLASAALDQWDWAHHLTYPAGAACMIASAWAYSRIRVRGEGVMIRQVVAERPNIWAGFQILRQDRAYGAYMFWQMVSGSSLLMTGPVLVLAVDEMFKVSFSAGTMLLVIVPACMQVLTVPLAGWMFDRTNIMRYRTVNALLWATGRFCVFAGLFARSLTLLTVGFAIQGLANATGNVVWNIGHTHFAPPEKSQLYMGIHLTLTGIRGLTMPFIGIFLYAHTTLGIWVIALACVGQVAAAIGFARSSPAMRRP